MWNHYNTIDDPRSNNHIEGFHLKLDSLIVQKKPHIWIFIEHTQYLETTYSTNYIRLEKDLLKQRGRSRKDIDRDNFILKQKCKYLEDHNLEKFLENLSEVVHDYSN